MIASQDRVLIKVSALALALGFCTAGAHAVVTYPGPYVGVDVTYTDIEEASADPIEDPEPLYGAPTLVPPNMLDFNPSAAAFSADSPPPDNTDGSLRLTVTSNTAAEIPVIIVTESGDYGFTGATSNGELVAATLTVRVLDPVTQTVIAQDIATFFEQFDNTPNEVGFWDNAVTISLAGLGYTEVELLIDNTLQATGNANVTAEIRKKDFKIDVPEPGTALLAFAGSGLMLLSRRRSA